jgi:molybdenum cofactor biosynthesis protein B
VAYQQHISEAKSISARCAVITLSDTRTIASDSSGQKIIALLTAAAHSVNEYLIVKDDPAIFGPLLDALLARDDLDLILTNGGTGISGRDQTVDAVQARIDLALPGFGELFRMLSYEQVGSGAMLSRATGGIARGKPIFAMPGSTPAVELAMEKLILPEIGHLLRELRKDPR